MPETPICGTSEAKGLCFWPFPPTPQSRKNIVKDTVEYFLRTDLKTGKISPRSVFPNNATVENFGELMVFLQAVTDEARSSLMNILVKSGIDIALFPGVFFTTPISDMQRAWNDLGRWQDRLDHYEEFVEKVYEANPGAMVGAEDSDSKMLSNFVAEPLFFGWYPNDLPPFSEQPMPYSAQTGQAGMDLGTPFSIATQAGVLGISIDRAAAAFKGDLKDGAEEALETGTKALIFVLVGLGIYAGITTGLLAGKK